jgi:hypothetical protein
MYAKGCANHTTVSGYDPDRCRRWDYDDSFEVPGERSDRLGNCQ